MALKSWASISTLADVIPYIQAEAAQAAKECPAAHQAYMNALSNAQNYQKVFGGTSMDNAYTIAVKTEVQEARNSWYASGCKAPSDQTPVGSGKTAAAAPPTIPDDSGGWWPINGGATPEPTQAGIGGGSWVLWALGGVVAFALFGMKGKGKGKAKPRAKAKKPAKKSRRR